MFAHLLVLDTEFPYVAQAEIIGTPSSGRNSYSTTPTGIPKMTNSELSLNVTVKLSQKTSGDMTSPNYSGSKFVLHSSGILEGTGQAP